MALKTSVDVRVSAALVEQSGSQRAAAYEVVKDVVTLANGTTSGKADVVYSDPAKTLGASASVSYDLSGSLTNGIGGAAVFAKVKVIAVKNSGAGAITIERPASNGLPFFDAAGDAITIPSGGSVTLHNPTGWTVTAGTGDLIDITADGSGATFAILIVGTSA